MININLERYYSPFGVHGRLITPSIELCTVEKPWHGNQPFISCIPESTYLCQRVQSPVHGDTYEVMEVPERTHILFHKGNSPRDVKGCIAVGKAWEILGNQLYIRDSYHGFRQFMEAMSDVNQFELTITAFRPAYP